MGDKAVTLQNKRFSKTIDDFLKDSEDKMNYLRAVKFQYEKTQRAGALRR